MVAYDNDDISTSYFWPLLCCVMVACDNEDASIFHKGSFTNYVDKILAFFDHLPPCVDIFYGMNVDKKWTFLDNLATSSCKRSL